MHDYKNKGTDLKFTHDCSSCVGEFCGPNAAAYSCLHVVAFHVAVITVGAFETESVESVIAVVSVKESELALF